MTPANGVRRAVDITAAVVGLTLLSPIILGSMVAVRIRMGKGVLFRQRRLGLGGEPFEVIKLRTMLHAKPGREAPEFDAERLTPFGSWLRATSIDELPSLVNLLRGDLTLVGPRPLPVHYWSRYRGEEYRRFEVKPGITGLAQINGRNTVDWPERLAIDVQYVEARSVLGDAKILLRTVPAVFGRHGIDQESGVTMTELPDR